MAPGSVVPDCPGTLTPKFSAKCRVVARDFRTGGAFGMYSCFQLGLSERGFDLLSEERVILNGYAYFLNFTNGKYT